MIRWNVLRLTIVIIVVAVCLVFTLYFVSKKGAIKELLGNQLCSEYQGVNDTASLPIATSYRHLDSKQSVPPKIFQCPENEESLSFSDAGKISLAVPSSPNRLCTLVQVASDSKSFKPIARSYAGRIWEASGGEFSYLSWKCSSSSCDVNLPKLPTGSVFQLTTFFAPVMFRPGVDEVARFLEQAAFGPTATEISTFRLDNLPKAFAGWINNQMMNVPVTSHRALFRRKLNAKMETATHNGAVTHPCQKGTRYRLYAFSSKDYEKYLEIETVGKKRVLKIDGFVRTVVDGPISKSWDPSVTWPDGSYLIDSTFYVDELGGTFRMYLPAEFEIHDVTFNGQRGNPGISFDSTIGASPNLLITLPSDSIKPIDDRYFENGSVNSQEIILTKDLSLEACKSIGEPGNPINPVFALYQDKYWIHDPHFEIISNTIEAPAPDGGGKVARETYNVVHNDRTLICSNAPRTFLNEDKCIFSKEATACSAESYDPLGGENRPNFYVAVNSESIRGIYDVTGGGTEGTRFLYAVDALRFEEDGSVGFPCERTTSRWLPIKCTGAASKLDKTMQDIFSTLLFYTEDSNPIMRDVWNWHETRCPAPIFQLIGFEVQDKDGKQCWKNVHPDHLNVYDMTVWTRMGAHPGNSINRNPIKEPARDGKTVLSFPSWHTMSQWATQKEGFGFVGRLGDSVHYYSLPSDLRSEKLNDYFGFTPESIQYTDSKGILICGSPYEVANDLGLGGSVGRGAFDSRNVDFLSTGEVEFIKQKRIVWTEAAFSGKDQLRQRVAWALSQILVVTPKAVSDGEYITEAFVTFYDIFVRNAFGNYLNILKEVSYSGIMAEMLTYYESRSTAYTWQVSGNIEYADENYAREIMQLFSVGMFQLNQDGSQKLDSKKNPLPVYSNDDIVEYARVWTGFVNRVVRGNIENLYRNNRVDPMRINMEFRDAFPKMGLNRKYIGDGMPLCSDLPKQHFLKVGATYRLLGSSSSPSLVADPDAWKSDRLVKRVKLQNAGVKSLFAKLCGSEDPSRCNFKSMVVLDTSLECTGTECSVDTLRVVEVTSGVFYEFTRPPCVYRAFFRNPKMVVRRKEWWHTICADPLTQVASAACCDSGKPTTGWTDKYWGERITFASAEKRCNKQLCNRWPRPECDMNIDPSLGSYCENNAYFWTNTNCKLRAKINIDGTVGIVHSPRDIEPQAIARHVQNETKTFFRVDWSSESHLKAILTDCKRISSCSISVDDTCVCDVSVKETQVYFEGDRPSRDQVLSSLKIGAFNPALMSTTTTSTTINGVKYYHFNGKISSQTILEVFDTNGVKQFRKNVKSIVSIDGSIASFRNPVHFISLSDGEVHQAHDETHAALEHYFYHSNTAPFLSIRFAQRFGISNPSPGFVKRIGNAFRTGSFKFSGGGSNFSFGSGKYGDLAATFACILLDRESRTVLLDADPTHGSLKEPLIKVIGLMRALEFQLGKDAGFLDFDVYVDSKLGEMAHAYPNVFSFFLPEYKPPGPLAQASLVAPEGQVMTGPRTIDMLNGMLSIIKYGFVNCLGGFAQYYWWDNYDCSSFRVGSNNERSLGKTTYRPSDDVSSEKITDKLATLLTAGRLSLSSRELIDEIVSAEPRADIAAIKAQQLMILSPEFHSTNLVRRSGIARAQPEDPKPSSKPYKALIYVLLDGGMDSYNMLVPHTCSVKNNEGKTLVEQYNSERTSLAMTAEERTRFIKVSDQPCSEFVIHQELEIVEKLYKSGDLAFFMNAGVINRPVNKNNYWQLTKTALFGHNTMQEEAQKIDPFNGTPGTGILGRLCDLLNRRGFSSQPVTVQDGTIATIGVPGKSVDPLIVPVYNTNIFNPKADYEDFDLRSHLSALNDATEMHSSLYGETWSQRLQKAVYDNESILNVLQKTKLVNSFADTEYSSKLKAVATLIAAQELRGTDRDVFFLSLSGWDHHGKLKASLASNFAQLNQALSSFYEEMKSQNKWQSVSLVITSDFSRTLTANSSEGSDHAWGGHYFMMGGSVKGGRVFGNYPSDITASGPYNIGRGRLIPTLSWESIINPMVQWMGVDKEEDLNYCMPNRRGSGAKLYQLSEVFES